MSESTHAARIVMAVQAALKAGDKPVVPIVNPGSINILSQLRDAGTDTVLIGDVADSQGDMSTWSVYKTLRALEDSGLVSVDESNGTIQLTASGKAAVGR